MAKQPSGHKNRRRKADALARGEKPKLGKPKGSVSPHFAERRAEIRKDVALIPQAKELEPFFFQILRRTVKSIADEIKKKGSWKRDEHGRRVRNDSPREMPAMPLEDGKLPDEQVSSHRAKVRAELRAFRDDFVKDPKKYSGIRDRTLDRDIETVEHKFWGGPRKKRSRKKR